MRTDPRALRLAAQLAALLAASGSLGSCVGYVRFQVDAPVSTVALGTLQAGRSDLGECLATLGAPDRVFEYRGNGVALLWSWRDRGDWSLDVSVPLQDQVSASFELDVTDEMIPGCVLWFGEDLVLERWQSGTLGEVLRGRVRPHAVE